MAIDPSVDLRAMVREVLREAIATRAATGTAAVPGPSAVSIVCDADLQTFVARLAAPGMIEAVRAGTVKFRLALAQPLAATAARPTVHLAMDGVISEQKLRDIATGATIALGPDAVLTPLAKDAARHRGLKFERNSR